MYLDLTVNVMSKYTDRINESQQESNDIFVSGCMRIVFFAIAILVAIVLCLCSCSKRVATATPTVIEHERTITNIRTEYKHDTVWLEVPAQSAEVVVRDSVSVLENDYATSTARINRDGTMSHSLATKPQKKPVERDLPVVYKDSIVYKDKEVQVPVPVEKKLTKWQSTCINWFPWAVLLLALSLGGIFRKPLLALVRRFI